jgi:hypothetical protein
MEIFANVTESDLESTLNNDPDNILTDVTDSLVVFHNKGKFIDVVSFHSRILAGDATHDTRLRSILGYGLIEVVIVDEMPEVRQ